LCACARARYPCRVHAWTGILALGLGLTTGCFDTDYLLGAVCNRDDQCGDDQCCSGTRCRPAPDYCLRGENAGTAYEFAYSACERDEDCIHYGLPHCVRLEGAPAGFCADLCLGVPDNCEKHPQSASRSCVRTDGHEHCALRCCSAACGGDSGPSVCPGQIDCPAPCPDAMECRDGVCVPGASS
jgi:hypothetical protein